MPRSKVDPSTITFAKFFDRWLDEREMTPSRFAQLTGTNQSLVTKWRNGIVTPNDKNLAKMVSVLGRPHDDLMRMAGRLQDHREVADDEHAEIEGMANEFSHIIAGVPRQHRLDVLQAASRIAETYRLLPTGKQTAGRSARPRR